MKKIYTISISILAILVILFGGVYVSNLNNNQVLSGVVDGQAYNSTTTYTSYGVPLINGGHTVLKSNMGGVLGSIDISGGSVAGKIVLWNATSTTDVSSTTLVVIPASAAAMTHVYDISFSRGLILETVSSLVPTSTITWR